MLFRTRVANFVERELGGKTICERCGATLETYDRLRSADLSVACEGFTLIERARLAAIRTLKASTPTP